MNKFNLTCEAGMSDFLDLLWYYVNNSHDEEIINYRIGVQSAVMLQDFLVSFLEYQEEYLREYALEHFDGCFGDFE